VHAVSVDTVPLIAARREREIRISIAVNVTERRHTLTRAMQHQIGITRLQTLRILWAPVKQISGSDLVSVIDPTMCGQHEVSVTILVQVTDESGIVEMCAAQTDDLGRA
jgi:hypothetical protein